MVDKASTDFAILGVTVSFFRWLSEENEDTDDDRGNEVSTGELVAAARGEGGDDSNFNARDSGDGVVDEAVLISEVCGIVSDAGGNGIE